MRTKTFYFDVNSPESMAELEGIESYDCYDPDGTDEIAYKVAHYEEHEKEIPF